MKLTGLRRWNGAINPARWIEYSLPSSLMMVVIAMLCLVGCLRRM